MSQVSPLGPEKGSLPDCPPELPSERRPQALCTPLSRGLGSPSFPSLAASTSAWAVKPSGWLGKFGSHTLRGGHHWAPAVGAPVRSWSRGRPLSSALSPPVPQARPGLEQK